MAKSPNEILSESEIALRMNNAVRRALNTPPKPLKVRVADAKSKKSKFKENS